MNYRFKTLFLFVFFIIPLEALAENCSCLNPYFKKFEESRINCCALLRTEGFVDRPFPAEPKFDLDNIKAFDEDILSEMSLGSPVQYRVGIKDGTLSLERSDNAPPTQRSKRPISLQTDSFNYTGENNGEWGGGLYLKRIDQSSSMPTEKLIDGNIFELFPHGDDLYVFTSLRHMLIEKGAIYIVKNYKTNPEAERVTLLPGAVLAVTHNIDPKLRHDEFVIVTRDALTIYEPEYERLSILGSQLPWASLNPNSLVWENYHFYVGMDSGIVTFNFGTRLPRRDPVMSDLKFWEMGEGEPAALPEYIHVDSGNAPHCNCPE